MPRVEQLKDSGEKTLKEINALIRQLSERALPLTQESLERIVQDNDVETWIVKDGEEIVGMSTLAVIPIPTGTFARVEDVIVDERYRGKGLGKLLSDKMIERAKARSVLFIDLNSKPTRVAANELYKKMGFELRETNTYRLKLS